MSGKHTYHDPSLAAACACMACQISRQANTLPRLALHEDVNNGSTQATPLPPIGATGLLAHRHDSAYVTGDIVYSPHPAYSLARCNPSAIYNAVLCNDRHPEPLIPLPVGDGAGCVARPFVPGPLQKFIRQCAQQEQAYDHCTRGQSAARSKSTEANRQSTVSGSGCNQEVTPPSCFASEGGTAMTAVDSSADLPILKLSEIDPLPPLAGAAEPLDRWPQPPLSAIERQRLNYLSQMETRPIIVRNPAVSYGTDVPPDLILPHLPTLQALKPQRKWDNYHRFYENIRETSNKRKAVEEQQARPSGDHADDGKDATCMRVLTPEYNTSWMAECYGEQRHVKVDASKSSSSGLSSSKEISLDPSGGGKLPSLRHKASLKRSSSASGTSQVDKSSSAPFCSAFPTSVESPQYGTESDASASVERSQDASDTNSLFPRIQYTLGRERSKPPPWRPAVEAECMRPRSQCPRFPGDLYTPAMVRAGKSSGQGSAAGDIGSKEGWCGLCPPVESITSASQRNHFGGWLNLRNSSYRYHLIRVHGISPKTGRPYQAPLETVRRDPRVEGRVGEGSELRGKCHQCHAWVVFGLQEPNNFFVHASKCHREESTPAATQGASAASMQHSARERDDGQPSTASTATTKTTTTATRAALTENAVHNSRPASSAFGIKTTAKRTRERTDGEKMCDEDRGSTGSQQDERASQETSRKHRASRVRSTRTAL